jgi:hypothetical protein
MRWRWRYGGLRERRRLFAGGDRLRYLPKCRPPPCGTHVSAVRRGDRFRERERERGRRIRLRERDREILPAGL